MTSGRTKLPELLAPAGSRKAFLGALKAGADAVYLGGEKFGARAYAENFTEEDIIRSIRDAHVFGRKVYLTLNVLTKESELEETVDFAVNLYEKGLDGVIVQDLGVLRVLHERCPGLELHASTQLSSSAPESVRFLKELGVRRVVPARELSLEEMHEQGYIYTKETLRRLRMRNPDTDYYFIMGADSLVTFHMWNGPQEICDQCVLVAAVRDQMAEKDLDEAIRSVRERFHADVRKLSSPNLDISSHTIRQWRSEGRSIRYYVTDPVVNYIYENGIYERL